MPGLKASKANKTTKRLSVVPKALVVRKGPRLGGWLFFSHRCFWGCGGNCGLQVIQQIVSWWKKSCTKVEKGMDMHGLLVANMLPISDSHCRSLRIKHTFNIILPLNPQEVTRNLAQTVQFGPLYIGRNLLGVGTGRGQARSPQPGDLRFLEGVRNSCILDTAMNTPLLGL